MNEEDSAILARRAKWRKYYYAHPERSKQRRIDSQKRNADFVDSFKTACVDCGMADKRTLDFHHLDETEKLRGVATLRVAGYSRKRILNEILKCVVLCANCHRIRHWEKHHEL